MSTNKRLACVQEFNDAYAELADAHDSLEEEIGRLKSRNKILAETMIIYKNQVFEMQLKKELPDKTDVLEKEIDFLKKEVKKNEEALLITNIRVGEFRRELEL